LAVKRAQTPPEGHQPAALGIDWTALSSVFLQGRAQAIIPRQLCRVQLGEPASEIEPVGVSGQPLVVERREGHDFGAALAQYVDRILVVEAERAVLGDANPHLRWHSIGVR